MKRRRANPKGPGKEGQERSWLMAYTSHLNNDVCGRVLESGVVGTLPMKRSQESPDDLSESAVFEIGEAHS